jgi:non-ribosomal peptide synthetase component F
VPFVLTLLTDRAIIQVKSGIYHRGISHLATSHYATVRVEVIERVLQFASLSVDASNWEVVAMLVKGGSLCLGTREQMIPGPSFVELWRQHDPTVVALHPCPGAAAGRRAGDAAHHRVGGRGMHAGAGGAVGTGEALHHAGHQNRGNGQRT